MKKVTDLESKLDDSERCPECGTDRREIDDKHGETVCSNCGLVLLENALDEHLPFGFDSNDPELQKNVHNGPPSTVMRHDKGLPTEISYKDIDAHGKPISQSMRTQFHRLRHQQRRTNADKLYDSIIQGLSYIHKHCTKNNLPRDIERRTAIIYKQAHKKKIVYGRSIQVVVAASLYAAFKQQGFTRTLDEIEAYTEVDRKSIGRAYRTLQRGLKLPVSLPNPSLFVPRFCTKLKLSPATQTKAYDLLREHGEKTQLNYAPASSAAAAIYIASVMCGERRTQPRIAEVAGITEVTIRNRYQTMRDVLGLSKRIFS